MVPAAAAKNTIVFIIVNWRCPLPDIARHISQPVAIYPESTNRGCADRMKRIIIVRDSIIDAYWNHSLHIHSCRRLLYRRSYGGIEKLTVLGIGGFIFAHPSAKALMTAANSRVVDGHPYYSCRGIYLCEPILRH